MLLAICKTHAPYCVHTTHCHVLFGSFCLALMAPGRVRKFPNDFADCVSGHMLPAADHMVRVYYWAMLPHGGAFVCMCMCWWQAERMVFVSCVCAVHKSADIDVERRKGVGCCCHCLRRVDMSNCIFVVFVKAAGGEARPVLFECLLSRHG